MGCKCLGPEGGGFWSFRFGSRMGGGGEARKEVSQTLFAPSVRRASDGSR